jgi:hypothetical protein
MKRTNLVLDGDRLEEARRLFGTKTYSQTVNKALEEAIRYIKIRSIPQFFGKIKWEGDLAEMRKPRFPATAKRRKKVAAR